VTCTIYVMNADGTAATPLTSLVWSSGDPEFSPDGSRIVFDSNKGGFVSAIWVMNANGSNNHRPHCPALEAFFPGWSPDGTQIVFADNCCLPYSNLYVMNADGSGHRQLTHVLSSHKQRSAFAMRPLPSGALDRPIFRWGA